ncbi:MAG: DinB family protein [Bdellovibrionales bacterium]|nr:DinB family protein [Bdellovibrionales bacterium]
MNFCYTPSVGKSLTKLDELMNQVSALVEHNDHKCEGVSDWSLYQQLEHILLANRGIATLLSKNAPPEKVKKSRIIGKILILLGFFPRGVAKAPKSAIPESLTQESLRHMCGEVCDQLRQIDRDQFTEPKRIIGNHPMFGGLTASEWARFMVVHTHHHLKIIADILR